MATYAVIPQHIWHLADIVEDADTGRLSGIHVLSEKREYIAVATDGKRLVECRWPRDKKGRAIEPPITIPYSASLAVRRWKSDVRVTRAARGRVILSCGSGASRKQLTIEPVVGAYPDWRPVIARAESGYNNSVRTNAHLLAGLASSIAKLARTQPVSQDDVFVTLAVPDSQWQPLKIEGPMCDGRFVALLMPLDIVAE